MSQRVLGRKSLVVLMTLVGSACLFTIGGCPPPPTTGGDTDEPTTGNTAVGGEFIGSERCALCHITTHNAWAETLHAKALDTLEAIGQDKNPNCIGCHTVGYGETGGFVDRATTNVLAGVGCEACHGGARAHAENASDRSLRPTVDLSASMCGRCHTGAHHPNFDEWETSKHATVTSAIASGLVAGSRVNSCGVCHSGDVFYEAVVQGETLAEDTFLGQDPNTLTPITCAICHDPHERTGNAANPDEGRDYQLRYAEVTSPTPTNTITAVQDKTRFNICGQCHHSRGRTWADTERGPHHSLQVNVYTGEMPLPDGTTDPLVFSRVSVHSFAEQQCATCHMYRQDFQDEQAPAIAGHSFEVNEESCATSGCHPSTSQALAVKTTLQAEIQGRLDEIEGLLGDPATWEYAAEGGPEDQSGISDAVKQARFLYYYALNDGSLGIHNPAYVRDMLLKAKELLTP